MSKLDPYEKEILGAFESGKLKKSKTEKQQIKRHAVAAEATFKKDARINGYPPGTFAHCKLRH